MAGRRRGTGKPLQRHAGAARRREQMQAKTLTTTDPVDRLTIATEYLRGALRRNPSAATSARIEDLTQQIVAAGDDADHGALQ